MFFGDGKVNQSETTLKYFDPLRTHKYHTHTHTSCLMMGEVSLKTSPKNIMILDMIDSENSKQIRMLVFYLTDLFRKSIIHLLLYVSVHVLGRH